MSVIHLNHASNDMLQLIFGLNMHCAPKAKGRETGFSDRFLSAAVWSQKYAQQACSDKIRSKMFFGFITVRVVESLFRCGSLKTGPKFKRQVYGNLGDVLQSSSESYRQLKILVNVFFIFLMILLRLENITHNGRNRPIVADALEKCHLTTV